MTEYAEKILDYLQNQSSSYHLSTDAIIRDKELKAIDFLIDNGYIQINTRSIGCVDARIL